MFKHNVEFDLFRHISTECWRAIAHSRGWVYLFKCAVGASRGKMLITSLIIVPLLDFFFRLIYECPRKIRSNIRPEFRNSTDSSSLY